MQTKPIHSENMLLRYWPRVLTPIQSFLLIMGFALATGLASQARIPIPGTPVPITLQTSVVLLAGLCLNFRQAFLSQLLYLCLGSLGLPFFTQLLGAASLIGPTGGYLIGFLIAAPVLSILHKKWGNSLSKTWILTFATSLIILVTGTLYLKHLLQLSWSAAWAAGFLPFLLGDLVKVTFSAITYAVGAPFLKKR